jgi:hypothetical protein
MFQTKPKITYDVECIQIGGEVEEKKSENRHQNKNGKKK